MNRIYSAIAGAVAIAIYTWWIYGLGADSVKAKTQIATTVEEKRQADDVGELKVAEADHAPKIITRIKIVREAADPSGCRDMTMPNDVLNALVTR